MDRTSGFAGEPSMPLRALLSAAAQAICDSGCGMGETVASVEEALAAQVRAAGATSIDQVALLACGGSTPGVAWNLRIAGSCAELTGGDAARGLSGPKRRRVVA
mmetsp:Transcript_85324/g.198378  ORF Transcript_85324/g.198378 Transcript_85324/m.198378 type:complete len:104 (-) Transcript_85324:147-458(-)